MNGKSLVYLEGESDKTVSGDVGQVILVRCSRITVKDLEISGTNMGIELYETSNSQIENNTISNIQGVGVYNCGIYLFSSSNNNVTGNSLTGNTLGIYLEYSSNNNTIRGNLVESNTRGIQIEDSPNNSVYHNSFINNWEQAYSYGCVNAWDDGSRGNYWSNYGGKDGNNDGIGDTPYIINEENKDRCPLMKPGGLEGQSRTEINLIMILVICGVIGIVVFLILVAILRKRQSW